METVVAFLAMVLLAAIGSTLALGHLFRDRWGPAGSGPFALFGGAVREERRGPPWMVVLTVMGSFIWAAFTLLAFAPAGMTLALILADQSLPFAVVLGALCLDGFALGTGLLVSGIVVLGRNRGVQSIAAGVAGWSVVHHIAIFGFFACLTYQEWPLEALIWLAAPCGIGVVLSLALAMAGRRAAPSEAAAQ